MQTVEIAEEDRHHLWSEPREAQRGWPLLLLQLASHQDVPACRATEERWPVRSCLNVIPLFSGTMTLVASQNLLGDHYHSHTLSLAAPAAE